jgi:hypothetical protein
MTAIKLPLSEFLELYKSPRTIAIDKDYETAVYYILVDDEDGIGTSEYTHLDCMEVPLEDSVKFYMDMEKARRDKLPS